MLFNATTINIPEYLYGDRLKCTCTEIKILEVLLLNIIIVKCFLKINLYYHISVNQWCYNIQISIENSDDQFCVVNHFKGLLSLTAARDCCYQIGEELLDYSTGVDSEKRAKRVFTPQPTSFILLF